MDVDGEAGVVGDDIAGDGALSNARKVAGEDGAGGALQKLTQPVSGVYAQEKSTGTKSSTTYSV